LIRIGTRGSALALVQASWVAERLAGEVQLITITTAGDRGAPAEDKSRWVSELERALLADEIDLAVHSAKDVPAELAEGLELVAIPERADPRDVICGAESLAALRAGARVGTSSLRRTAQIKASRDDVEVVGVRGNVDTRLRKLQEHQFDALVLALAGLQRLGRGGEGQLRAAPLIAPLDQLVPAAGQGALALEARPGRIPAEMLAPLIDPDATDCVNAERELVHALGASCNTPVGAHARVLGGGELELVGWVGLPDGSEWISDRLRGPPDRLGVAAAQRMLAVGAGELLVRAEREVHAAG
jgi:hydroxymethylbilane synthase